MKVSDDITWLPDSHPVSHLQETLCAEDPTLCLEPSSEKSPKANERSSEELVARAYSTHDLVRVSEREPNLPAVSAWGVTEDATVSQVCRNLLEHL